jgi:hypothetical protein
VEDPIDSDGVRIRIRKPNPPVTDTEAIFGRQDTLKPFDIALRILSESLNGSDDSQTCGFVQPLEL